MTDEEFAFLEKLLDQNVKKGETITFECPICNGEVTASRSSYNGHLHATCSKCGINCMQ